KFLRRRHKLPSSQDTNQARGDGCGRPCPRVFGASSNLAALKNWQGPGGSCQSSPALRLNFSDQTFARLPQTWPRRGNPPQTWARAVILWLAALPRGKLTQHHARRHAVSAHLVHFFAEFHSLRQQRIAYDEENREHDNRGFRLGKAAGEELNRGISNETHRDT